MRQHIVRAVLLGAMCLPHAFGQAASARIVGSITDASGAVIPAAGITLKNERTGESRKSAANENGQYLVTNLAPSSYSITVEAKGMANAEMKGVTLQVGQERTLNITMQPSTVTTEVQVSSGELASVETNSAAIGANVSTREVATLPINGRQVSQLYLLTPGAVNYGSGTFDDIRFSGRSNEQNALRYDGIEGSSIIDSNPGNFNGEITGLFRVQSSLENVQEFRVESNNFPAEFGTGTGGQISVVTKSGSNNLHGSAFEYLRNTSLDARNFFDGANPSVLKLNQFGGSIGGPIVKDKAFFFAGYEGMRQRTSVPIVETTPSALAWSQAVPAIQALRAAFPVGQFASSNPLLDVASVQGPGSVDENSGTIRFDYNFNDKFRFYTRYNRDQGEALVTQNSTLSYYTETAVPQNLVASLNQILSPTIINETKFGFNGSKTRVNATAPQIPGVDLTGVTINLTGSVALAGIAGQAGSAGIAAPTGQLRLSSALNGRAAPYTNYSLSFIDSLSVIRGTHALKFGVEVRPITMYTSYQGGVTYAFSNIQNFLADSPSSVSFNGDTTTQSPFTGKGGVTHLKQTYYIFYAQDEWKIKPNLTMSYGLRYEYYSPMQEANDKVLFFDIPTGSLKANYSGDWYKTSKLNFGPRLAFSWQPEKLQKTVFRIGAGYYYGPGQGEDQIQPALNDRINRTITSGSLLTFPVSPQTLLSSFNISDPNLQFQPRAYDPGYQIPEKVLQYTASIQQQLPSDTVLTVAYVGSQGRNLFLRGITNKITGVTMNPTTGVGTAVREFGNQFAEIDLKTSGGNDHYNGLQTSLNRRFSQGLTLGAQYVWSHSLGNTDGSNEARTSSNNYSYTSEYGNNTFDVRQSFNLSALYEVPFGKAHGFGSNAGPVAKAILGGWQVGGIVNARTGLPIEVLITRPDIVYRNNSTGAITSAPVVSNGVVLTTPIVNVPGGGNSRNIRRPDLVPGVDPYLRNSETQWINPAAFAVPQAGTYGNLARDAFYGPATRQLDMTFDKKFFVREQTNVEFRAEIYNIFNRANFQAPGGGTVRLADATGTLQPGQAYTASTAGGNFGAITSTVSNQIGLGTNRQFQLSLRLNF
jgi:Carboxypeptidase regulatory-like domain